MIDALKTNLYVGRQVRV